MVYAAIHYLHSIFNHKGKKDELNVGRAINTNKGAALYRNLSVTVTIM